MKHSIPKLSSLPWKTILLAGIILAISGFISYRILTPQPKLVLYGVTTSEETLNNLRYAIESQREIPTNIQFIPWLQKSGSELSFIPELNVTADTEIVTSLVQENLFLHHLVQTNIQQAKHYIDIRVANIDLADWKSLLEYQNLSDDLDTFIQKEQDYQNQIGDKSLQIQELAKQYDISPQNTSIVFVNNQFISSFIESPYHINVAIARTILNNPNRTSIPFIDSSTRYHGIAEAYTDKDCNYRSDAYGSLTGRADNSLRCEFVDAQPIEVTILSREDTSDINLESERRLISFIQTNIKSTEITQSDLVLSQEIVNGLELSPDTRSIAQVSANITESPLFASLSELGVIKEYQGVLYIIL